MHIPWGHDWRSNLTGNVNQSADSPLAVDSVGYLENTTIYQSSPYPCDENVITVKIQPNISLSQICEPVVKIQGFHSVLTPGYITIQTDSSVFNTTAEVTAAYDVVVKIVQSANERQVHQFTFNITNPGDISARDNTPFSLITTFKGACSRNFSFAPYDALVPTCYSDQKEYWPLNLRRLAILTKDI
eukprot:7698-Hanusia_phi.AAC.1